MTNATQDHLILVPGLLCSPDLFADQVAALSPSIAITVADHTRADRVEAMAAGILAAAPRRFALAGLSMGGYVVFEMVRQAPERITRVALLDTSPLPDPPERTADRRQLMDVARSRGVREVQGMLLPRLIHPDRRADAALVARVLEMADDTGLEAFLRQQEAIIARPDSRPTLAAIGCPALVLVGAEDLLTPLAVAEQIAAGIAGSRLVVVPGCGHLSTMERPVAVNAALRTWLEA